MSAVGMDSTDAGVSVETTSGGKGVKTVSSEMVGKGVGSAGWNGVGVGRGIEESVTRMNGNPCFSIGVGTGACPQAVRRSRTMRVKRRRGMKERMKDEG
jgi:hypothetical protein